ncbi:hypothetical protein Emed_003723 [Eimeria media]
MAFDARKAWIKRRVTSAFQLVEPSIWDSLMAKDNRRAERELEHFLDEATSGAALFFTLKICDESRGVEEMDRCVLLSHIGPRVLDDLALILNSLLVPSLQSCLAPPVEGDSKQQDAAIPAEAAAAASSKPTSAQLLDAEEKLPPAASSDSQLAESELAEDDEADGTEGSEASQPWSRQESAQVADENEDVSLPKEAAEPDLSPEDQVVEPDHSLSPGFDVDPARAAETLAATLELLNQITTTSTTTMAPLPMPPDFDATDNSPQAISNLEDIVSQWQQITRALLESEQKRKSESCSPLSEINFWRNRYFKNLETSPIKALSETVAALMDALRMVWVTSRHFTTDERMQGLMEKIAYQLEMRVRQEINMKELLKGDLDESIAILQQSRELLEAWKSEYFNMRTLLEESECNRSASCAAPDFQALVRSFDSFCFDIFDERNAAEVIETVNTFRRQTEELESDCVAFLDTKFTRLRSALSAFKMLKDFTTTASRPKINAKLGEKFVDILHSFNLEVDHMREIFERGRNNPVIPSHMPPTSGAILWSSGLLQSLKTSVLAFKQLPEVFDGNQAEVVFGNYLDFAKSITAYQKDLVKQWQQVEAAAAASESLKAYILRQEANGTYAVNFRPELWVVMQEARHLNLLGVHEAPVAVLNVALHKERFYQHYVLLESLVEKLNSTLSSTLPAHKSLLSRQIAELHRAALPGLTTLNWTSLGLEDFVASCLKAMTVFKATCEQVFKNVEVIEQIVKEIENSQLVRDLDWDSFAPFNIQDYYDYFENHRAREVEKLRCVPTDQLPADEAAAVQFTFYSEVSRLPALINSTVATHQAIQKAFQHITKYVRNWSKYEDEWGLWNPNRKAELDALVAKKPSLVYFDVYVRAYDKLAAELACINGIKTIGFIQLDSSEVINGIRKQALVLSKAYADTLHQIAMRERAELDILILRKRSDFETKHRDSSGEHLEMEANSLDTFKLLMESVTTVSEIAMDTEIRLAELQEIYTTLLSYSYFVNGDEEQQIRKLPGAWKDLRNLAHQRKRQLVAIKAKFALEKQHEARDLQEEISAFKRRAADLNSAENLFSLPISPFPVLERLDQDVTELQKVYALYADHDALVKEWAGQLWANVDFQELQKGAEEFKQKLKRLAKEGAAMMKKIRKWEKSLNIIREVLDAWLQVQRKWMYLDGIFTESIDIRLQLPEEAKKFDTINRRFLSIMKQTSENPNVLSAFCLENRLGEMKGLAADLDSCQRSLSDYLDAKRIMYPRSDPRHQAPLLSHSLTCWQSVAWLRKTFSRRFYFISDDELLSVLGSTGHEAVQPLMLKLFDNCKLLQVNASGQVSGMESEEGETYHFVEAVAPEGPAEEWMTLVDEAMKSSLYGITKDGVFLYGCKPRTQWVMEQLGMVTCVATRIWWTWRVEDAFDRMEKGEKNALREEAGVQRQQASRFPLFNVLRESIEPAFALEDAVFSSSNFDWESQLRFYWDAAIGDVETCRQFSNAMHRYGYEYQGLNGHLVITPLTDRCIMTLTTALTFFLGGAPAGPAGFWGCFDEFNRINPEVLSVVSAQIKAIQTSLQNGKGSVELLGKSLKFIPTTGIFVTMNPGYAGRSELPDNLKALFRPATMTVPDMAMICEIMLISEGFQDSRVLARKMTVLYRLAQAQLSKQLRALKAVLVTAGSMKRTAPDASDTVLLMRALRDMNIPKLIKPDVPLFLGLLRDLFPGVSCERVALPSFQEAVQMELQSKGFKSRHKQEFENQVDKVVQLHETMETRHSTMVVGPTGGGKTVIIEALAAAYKKAFDKTVKMFPINPKAQGTNELYGVLDPISRDWTDGLLSKIFRDANQPLVGGRKEKRLILFDGDVDAVWVENMNSVMDDNKILTLPNGERIRLEQHCALLFEVSDLRYASPATVSRCGMVYVDQRDLGSGPYYDCWARSKSSEALLSVLDYLWEKYVPQCLAFLFQEKGREDELPPPAQCVQRSDVAMVAQLCNLIDMMLPDLTGGEAVADKIENAFLFALVWSLGATLKEQERDRFDKLLRTLSGKGATFPDFFDSIYDVHSSTWLTWEKQINFSSRTTSLDFQKALEDSIDKRIGRVYGPPSGKVLKVFLDDLSMPTVDTYGTQQPVALLRFVMERMFLYERGKDLEKIILKDVHFLGAMNPPGNGRNFPVLTKLPLATLQLYESVVETMTRTPKKFHYIFNMRDLSRIFQGIWHANLPSAATEKTVVRLWSLVCASGDECNRHECLRVFQDRLIDEQEKEYLNHNRIKTIIEELFPDVSEFALRDPIIWTDFQSALQHLEQDEIADSPNRTYDDHASFEEVRPLLERFLELHNCDNKPMNLVMFEDAIAHIARVHRIIRMDRGHALLIGVGGSGKRSVATLAIFVAGYNQFCLTPMRSYGEAELKEDLRTLITLAARRRQCLLFSDADVKRECFLEYLNNLLTVGTIPALFADDQKEALIASIREYARAEGAREDSLWSYATSRATDNLHVILAMSPSGDALRDRCRSFPGLISCTNVDWFQPWSVSALAAVAKVLLQNEDLQEEHRLVIQDHVVEVHSSVTDVYAPKFERKFGRLTFATPKNYIDFLKTYKGMLRAKRHDIDQLSSRLEGGLQKMSSDQAIINQEKASADEALAAAIPALEAAAKALENLDKKDITEIKAFMTPPKPVMNVCMCVVVLRPLGRENEADGWNGAKAMLNDVNFLKSLIEYPKDNITERQVRKIAEYFNKDPDSFTSEKMAKISKAGNGLLTWVKAMIDYHEVAKGVEPKRKLVAELQQKQEEAEKNLSRIRLEGQLETLMADQKEQTAILSEVEAEARTMERRLIAACKLIDGLESERLRWTEERTACSDARHKLVGSCLVGAAFLSYAGPYTLEFRNQMLYEHWAVKAREGNIPINEPFRIEGLLTTDADVAKWNSEGLPANEMSIQNGILTTMSARWPLCIDPQLQNYVTTFSSNLFFQQKSAERGVIFALMSQVTITGLAEQMLAIVVGNEVPDLENQRQELVKRMSEGRLMLKQLENSLLYELAHSKGSPLDNEDLIATLQSTKTKALEIEQFLREAKTTAAQIEEKRQEFYSVAKRGSVCYFSMDGMRHLSPMLEYSLDAFIHTFQVALKEARQDRILENRLKSLSDKVTQLSYDYVSLGLFESQRLIFAFHLTTMIMRHDDKLSDQELEFFLKGSTSISENPPRPEQLSWLSDSGWNDLCKIDTVHSNFRGLKDSIIENSKAWQQWADADSAEKLDMPGQWSQVVSPFQKLIIMRVFRVDRVHNAIKQFIQGRLNEHYVQSPTLQYSKIYAQSSELSPILLILSPGANPHAAVSALADAVGLPANKFRSLSIGQGMGEQAQQLVEAGYQRGFWIMLQNCHLLPAWLGTLAKLLQDMKKPHAGFRLWLTSQPTNVFPLSILQERRKYGKMGWNVPYDFNESDLSISISLAKMYLDKSRSLSEGTDKDGGNQESSLKPATNQSNESIIPWETLRYLIGEAIYGGRVTDDCDRRVLETYLDEYLGEFLFDTYRQFSFCSRQTGYTLPSDDTCAGHIEFIKSMPTTNSPEVFGLHSNAEIGYFVDNAKLIWQGLLKINRSSASGNRNESASGGLEEDTLVETLSDILEKLPKKNLYYATDSDALSPTQVVLAQELDRLNRLVEEMSQSLHDLLHALRGDIGMSAELDELSSAIQTGFVPPQWRAFAPPSCKPLGSWLAHLLRRITQYTKWMEEGSLISYWLGGLHVPDSLLTAIIQQTSRKRGLALDKLVLLSEVTDLASSSSIPDPLEFGTYVEGMYIEGARWDAASRCLAPQHPRKLFEELPLVKVVPVESHRLNVRNLLKTPVYATQARRNAMGEGWVFDAWLPYSEHGSFWILTGTAIVLQTSD